MICESHVIYNLSQKYLISAKQLFFKSTFSTSVGKTHNSKHTEF